MKTQNKKSLSYHLFERVCGSHEQHSASSAAEQTGRRLDGANRVALLTRRAALVQLSQRVQRIKQVLFPVSTHLSVFNLKSAKTEIKRAATTTCTTTLGALTSSGPPASTSILGRLRLVPQS
jgi:hypothetical protein